MEDCPFLANRASIVPEYNEDRMAYVRKQIRHSKKARLQ